MVTTAAAPHHRAPRAEHPVRRRRAGVVVIAVFGALCTAVAGMFLLRPSPVYWSTVQVRFLPPTSSNNPNNLQIGLGSIVMTANAVREMVDDRDEPQPSSPDVTIVDEGIRDGWSVTLPNSGGQYQTVYVDPYLVVQAVSPDPRVVRARMDRLLRRIDADLAALQAAQHVDRSVQIQTARSSETLRILVAGGSRLRAGAGCLVLGLIGTAVLVRIYTAMLARRRRAARSAPHTAA